MLNELKSCRQTVAVVHARARSFIFVFAHCRRSASISDSQFKNEDKNQHNYEYLQVSVYADESTCRKKQEADAAHTEKTVKMYTI